MSLADTLNRKLWGDMSTGHFIGMVIGCCVALLVMCFLGSTIIGWLLAAAMCYLIAHLFHNSHKQKVILGAVTCLLIVIIGGAEIGPNAMQTFEDDYEKVDTDYFHDVTVTYDDALGTLTVTTEFGDDLKGYTPAIGYSNVSMIVYGGVYTETLLRDMELFDISSKTYTFTDWDTSKLHYFTLVLAEDSDGKLMAKEGSVGFTDGCITDDSGSRISWIGAAYATAFFGAIFFIITLGSWFFRSRMKKTRKKLEEQGRLYPQGYGRCAKCGAIVLPGEVECRKCGTYIDRPDEMKPNKVDYFRCTNCGAEVPAMAEVCPKCGATFTEEETEVIHADGSVTIEESLTCPDCGASVPPGSDGVRICPKCGKRFQE